LLRDRWRSVPGRCLTGVRDLTGVAPATLLTVLVILPIYIATDLHWARSGSGTVARNR